jgi:hypothetical protein
MVSSRFLCQTQCWLIGRLILHARYPRRSDHAVDCSTGWNFAAMVEEPSGVGEGFVKCHVRL